MDKAIKRYMSLSDQERSEFLALLCYYLSLSARGSYTEAGNDITTAVSELRVYNEMLQVVSKQLLAALGSSMPGYPPEAFFSILVEEAKRSSCEGYLGWTLYESFKDIDLRKVSHSDKYESIGKQ